MGTGGTAIAVLYRAMPPPSTMPVISVSATGTAGGAFRHPVRPAAVAPQPRSGADSDPWGHRGSAVRRAMAGLTLLTIAPIFLGCAPAAGVDGRLDEHLQEGDGGVADAVDGATHGGTATQGRAYYPTGRALSPMTTQVVEHLRELRASHPELHDDVFGQAGDSISANAYFMNCFDGDPAGLEPDGGIDLADHPELERAILFFRGGDAAGGSPFARSSLATKGGQTATWAITTPIGAESSPLLAEIDAIRPRFMIVMFGTNDLGWNQPKQYLADMRTLVETLLDRGVIPILSTIPHYHAEWAEPRVPLYNGIVRYLAEHYRLPLMDYWQVLDDLPGHGLWDDGVHPSAGGRPCDFRRDYGLYHGQNRRNLLAMQMLDLLQRVVIDGEDAFEDDSVRPYADRDGVPLLPAPYIDVRDTTIEGASVVTDYGGYCGAQNAAATEVAYRLEVATTTRLRARILSIDEADLDLYLLTDDLEGDRCLYYHDNWLTTWLYPKADGTPRTYWLTVDGAEAGEFLIVRY